MLPRTALLGACTWLLGACAHPSAPAAEAPDATVETPSGADPSATDTPHDASEEEPEATAPVATGEVITFDGMDAEANAPDPIRAAPRRKPIERFKLFGEGPR